MAGGTLRGPGCGRGWDGHRAQRVARRQQEVGGLHVAVQYAGTVNGAQQPQHFEDHHRCVALPEGSTRLHARLQALLQECRPD